MAVTEMELRIARELGRDVHCTYGTRALTAYSTDGARQSMMSMAREVLGIDGDPTDDQTDVLADEYWHGVSDRNGVRAS